MGAPKRDDSTAIYITLPSAARRIGVGTRVLRRARDSGELPVYRIGSRWERISVEELEAWVKKQRVSPGA